MTNMTEDDLRESTPPKAMRVAVVHDWLVAFRGGERVLKCILALFPQADVFTMVFSMPEQDSEFLDGHRVITSALQKLPGGRRHYRSYLPLMPLLVEQFDLSGYDLIISSSHAVAKGVLTGPAQLHICYCHSPMRYAWDLQHRYLVEAGLTRGLKGWLAKYLLHSLRTWDFRTAQAVDVFVANSRFVRERIRKAYRRDSAVINPPVDISAFTVGETKEDFYLAASALVPYKLIPLIVEAFSLMPEKRLVVIGDGVDAARIKRMAGPNVTILGHQTLPSLRSYMQRAKAFVMAALEDFGIMPLEAQACGTPVIAYGRGGLGETIKGLDSPNPTGVLFYEQTRQAICDAVRSFEKNEARITAAACRANAESYGEQSFRRAFSAFVRNAVQTHGDLGSRIEAGFPEMTAEFIRPAEVPSSFN